MCRSDTLCPQVWRAMWNRGKCCKSALFHPQFPPVVVLWTRCYARRSRDPERSGTSGVERPIELTAETLWNEVAGRLKGALNETTYRTWFAEAEGHDLTDDAFVLGVPNDFTREWIEGHFLGLIGAAVRDVTGQERRIALSVTERVLADAPAPAEAPKGGAGGAVDSGMNPKYTFDLFVIGSSNRFAHAAPLAGAEAPAQAYKPLFIYGGGRAGQKHPIAGRAHKAPRAPSGPS